MLDRMMILGHRGSVLGKPTPRENTLDAFSRAIEQGADGVELDVRRARDGSLLLHHDPDADGRPVADMTTEDRPDSMPTLDEALDVLAGSLVNIEIKNLPPEPGFDPACAVSDSVVEALSRRGGADRVIVSSFHPGTIDRVGQLAPEIATGVLIWFAPSPVESVEAAKAAGYDAIHPHLGYVTEEFVSAAHDAGLAVNVWTVNDRDSIARMIDLGVDAIVTDDIPAALTILDGHAGNLR